ncbi:MAG: tRNA pseudouridine(38-40) synthase TruA [Deltaproteobacteria bacterium]|nr:tRNA pseudouridine(38-40) synthase TruA [Deltaproteobacteria bacterium]
MKQKKKFKVVLAYDGTNYHGWQRQPGMITLQEALEEKIQQMTGEDVRVIVSGRTDAGVHALNQVCHFFSTTGLDPDVLKKGLNSLLPDDIFVKVVSYASPDFHARYSARSKSYEYRILNRRDPDVFLRHYSWHIPQKLEIGEMKECLSLLRGRHDFSSFRSSGSPSVSPVREMYRCEVTIVQGEILNFLFEANGFLRHMVRNIMGTLVEVGMGKMCYGDFQEIFQSKDRTLAGIKAPPQGLFLTEVKY